LLHGDAGEGFALGGAISLFGIAISQHEKHLGEGVFESGGDGEAGAFFERDVARGDFRGACRRGLGLGGWAVRGEMGDGEKRPEEEAQEQGEQRGAASRSGEREAPRGEGILPTRAGTVFRDLEEKPVLKKRRGGLRGVVEGGEEASFEGGVKAFDAFGEGAFGRGPGEAECGEESACGAEEGPEEGVLEGQSRVADGEEPGEGERAGGGQGPREAFGAEALGEGPEQGARIRADGRGGEGIGGGMGRVHEEPPGRGADRRASRVSRRSKPRTPAST
jgi:hypothetical protein